MADESGVYVHGTYRWNQQFPNDESFVRKYAHDGTLLWKFRDSEGNPDGYRIARIRAQDLLLFDGFLYASSWRGQGYILRKFTLGRGARVAGRRRGRTGRSLPVMV